MSLPELPICSTCAGVLAHTGEFKHDFAHENIQQPCCHRFVCGKCIDKNPRFMNYCPFCQITTIGAGKSQSSFSVLPPSYSPTLENPTLEYTTPTRDIHTAPGVIHYLRPQDTLISLSLLYHTPAPLIRSHNSLFSDHLLPALRIVSIPPVYYQGLSLSPKPFGDPHLLSQKDKVKRFQLRTKCLEAKLGQWYLQESNWDEDKALQMWEEDEEWEKNNPLPVGVQGGKRGCRRQSWGVSGIGDGQVSDGFVEEAKERELNQRKSRRRWNLLGLGSVMG